MKMTTIEKYFVNGKKHTLQVARRARQLLDRVNIRTAQRYLDVGCGVGTGCEVAAKCGMDVTGIDIDPWQIEAARKAYPHLRFIVMDAAKLHFEDAEFDIVSTSMATHHMPDWESAFSEMIRVLKFGGYLIHSDLMLPVRLAAVGRRFFPFVRFPSAKLIESIASGGGLSMVYQFRASLRFDFIWTKNNWRCGLPGKVTNRNPQVLQCGSV
jgi:SAM-dependent methyltransferase